MKNNYFLNIGIITGGSSVEHEISLISALQAILNIDKTKYKIYPIYLTKNNNLIYIKNLKEIKDFEKYTNKKTNAYIYKEKNKTYLKTHNKKIPLDCIIPIVHGKNTEDGTLSGYLNLLNIPYTSSDITSSSIAQDKAICKRLLRSYQIRLLPFMETTNNINLQKIDKFIDKHNFPLIIKPSHLGSSIGINTANNKEELIKGINNSLNYDKKLIIEPKLKNFTEYNCAAYKKLSTIITSEIEEVKTNHDILTYDDKYLDGGLKQTDKESRSIPAIISKELEEEIKKTTKQVYEYLNFKGVIRIDYIYDLDKNTLYLNEINTIPGSLAFYLFEGLNIDYSTLLSDLIKQAIIENNTENNLISSFDTNILNLKNIPLKK